MDLRKARERRGWSRYQAARRMEGVGQQTLINLEEDPAIGSEVKVRTMLEIIRAYWPDVGLDDFVRAPRAPFMLVPHPKRRLG